MSSSLRCVRFFLLRYVWRKEPSGRGIVTGSQSRSFRYSQKLPAKCGNVLTNVKSFLQIAATFWQLSKAPCKMRQRFGNCQKLPADCGNVLATAKSFLQIAAKKWQLPKTSCRLQQRNGSCQKLLANCSKWIFFLIPIAAFHYLVSDTFYWTIVPFHDWTINPVAYRQACRYSSLHGCRP